jgi:hypothetical protein
LFVFLYHLQIPITKKLNKNDTGKNKAPQRSEIIPIIIEEYQNDFQRDIIRQRWASCAKNFDNRGRQTNNNN